MLQAFLLLIPFFYRISFSLFSPTLSWPTESEISHQYRRPSY